MKWCTALGTYYLFLNQFPGITGNKRRMETSNRLGWPPLQFRPLPTGAVARANRVQKPSSTTRFLRIIGTPACCQGRQQNDS